VLRNENKNGFEVIAFFGGLVYTQLKTLMPTVAAFD
jgi:hypothetical protein